MQRVVSVRASDVKPKPIIGITNRTDIPDLLWPGKPMIATRAVDLQVEIGLLLLKGGEEEDVCLQRGKRKGRSVGTLNKETLIGKTTIGQNDKMLKVSRVFERPDEKGERHVDLEQG